MTKVTPSQGKDKWVNRLSAATTDITNGVDRVTEAPGAKAAAKFNKWQSNLQASGEKWKRNTGKVSLEEWKGYMKNVGIPRVAQGAQAKQGKYEAFANDFYPYLDQGVAKVNNMPDTTFEERVQRAVQMMRHNRQFKRS